MEHFTVFASLFMYMPRQCHDATTTACLHTFHTLPTIAQFDTGQRRRKVNHWKLSRNILHAKVESINYFNVFVD
jgi:hypothetical protein